MYEQDKTGLEFIEGFALLAMALWIGGALFLFALVMMGASRL